MRGRERGAESSPASKSERTVVTRPSVAIATGFGWPNCERDGESPFLGEHQFLAAVSVSDGEREGEPEGDLPRLARGSPKRSYAKP